MIPRPGSPQDRPMLTSSGVDPRKYPHGQQFIGHALRKFRGRSKWRTTVAYRGLWPLGSFGRRTLSDLPELMYDFRFDSIEVYGQHNLSTFLFGVSIHNICLHSLYLDAVRFAFHDVFSTWDVVALLAFVASLWLL